MIDAGRKSIDPSARQPSVRGIETAGDVNFPPEHARFTLGDMSFSAEHGRFTLAIPSDYPRVGDRVFLQSGYSDQMCHLHEYFIGVRNGIVATVWPIQGRGRLQ